MVAMAIAGVTALLRDAGWHVNRRRVERIWRREGLKVRETSPLCWKSVKEGNQIHDDFHKQHAYESQ